MVRRLSTVQFERLSTLPSVSEVWPVHALNTFLEIS